MANAGDVFDIGHGLHDCGHVPTRVVSDETHDIFRYLGRQCEG
jgi:hypothetical protein